jgi:hypothetical protein
MSCCDLNTQTFTVGGDDLIAGDHVQTSTVKATAAVAVKRGDLLKISAANVATLATDPADWDVIAAVSLTVAQATAHAAESKGYGVYNQGEFSISQVSIGGVALTAAQYDAAMAVGTKRNIELRVAA